MYEVHQKKNAIVTVDVDLQQYVVFSSIVEATIALIFLPSSCLLYFFALALFLPYWM